MRGVPSDPRAAIARSTHGPYLTTPCPTPCQERERLFVEGQNAKCEAALAMWQAGECSRMDAIEAMPDRAWGTERAEQWSGILGDRGTGDDQIARTKFGFNLNVTGAAWTTCACEAVIGTVMLVFDADVFLSVAQDNFDGRGDASLLRFDRAELEAAQRSFSRHPSEWFSGAPHHPPRLVLPREHEGIPSQKKSERSLGWHLVAYEELIRRHGPLVAATLMEDCKYESEYGSSGHPTYGYADPTNGNIVAFEPTSGASSGLGRSGFSTIRLAPVNATLSFAEMNENHARACRVLMEVLWRNVKELYADFDERYTKHRIVHSIHPYEREEVAFERCGAGALAAERVVMRHFHASMRTLVERGRATPIRTTRRKDGQDRLVFLYRDTSVDVFRKVVDFALPPKPAPPPLDPRESSLTGGRVSDGGGCVVM